jgi:signal transduction histidine kinase
LLDNAVKFTAEGSVTLEVQRVPGAESSVRFTVRDTGIGLTASDRERLFRPFVQGDGSVTRRYGGIGLGLVICQQLITLMQGRMGVGTDTGHGSAFWFELPLESTR